MQSRNKRLIIFIIITSLLPFLALLRNVDFALYFSRPAVFWARAVLVLGSVSGFVGIVMMFWQFTLGTRFIASRFSFDTVWFNKLHQKIGIYGVSFVFLHPVLKAVSNSGGPFFMFGMDFSNPVATAISYGRIAFLLLIVVWVSSAILRGRIKYRPWLYIHYLAYPIMFFSILHARNIGSYLNSVPWLTEFWSVLTLWFYAVVVFRLAKFLGIGSYKYELVEKTQVGGEKGDIFIYRFKPLSSRKIIPGVGQYAHIQLKPFGEAHPFTIMESDFSTSELTFGIKAQGPFTRKLSELIPGARVSLDGPYGVFTVEGQDSGPKVIIAGGIGVTPFVDLVKRFSNDQTYMFYANRLLNLAVRREVFKEALDGRYYDVLDHGDVEGENILHGKLTAERLEQSVPGRVFKEGDFFICGSKHFYKNYRELLLSMNVPAGKIHYEEFGF